MSKQVENPELTSVTLYRAVVDIEFEYVNRRFGLQIQHIRQAYGPYDNESTAKGVKTQKRAAYLRTYKHWDQQSGRYVSPRIIKENCTIQVLTGEWNDV